MALSSPFISACLQRLDEKVHQRLIEQDVGDFAEGHGCDTSDLLSFDFGILEDAVARKHRVAGNLTIVLGKGCRVIGNGLRKVILHASEHWGAEIDVSVSQLIEAHTIACPGVFGDQRKAYVDLVGA